MRLPLSDKEISELYQQRKNQVNAPTIDLKSLSKTKSVFRPYYQKFSIIFGVSCLASFSIFALMNYLKQVDQITATTIEIIVHRDIKLEVIKNEPNKHLALTSTAEKLPQPPKASQPPPEQELPTLIHIVPVLSKPNLTHQLAKQNLVLNTEISANRLNIVLTKKVQPKYPRQAQQQKIQGYVKLSYQINSSGNTYNIEIVDSNNKIFVKSAKKALKQWQYEKPNEGTVNETIYYQVEFTFKLNNN